MMSEKERDMTEIYISFKINICTNEKQEKLGNAEIIPRDVRR